MSNDSIITKIMSGQVNINDSAILVKATDERLVEVIEEFRIFLESFDANTNTSEHGSPNIGEKLWFFKKIATMEVLQAMVASYIFGANRQGLGVPEGTTIQ